MAVNCELNNRNKVFILPSDLPGRCLCLYITDECSTFLCVTDIRLHYFASSSLHLIMAVMKPLHISCLTTCYEFEWTAYVYICFHIFFRKRLICVSVFSNSTLLWDCGTIVSIYFCSTRVERGATLLNDNR